MYLGYLGIFLGVMYTGFFKLAYNGLGDLAVFIGFGPLMVYGAALMQNLAVAPTQSIDPIVTLFYSVPVGIFIALVLFINCFQDYNADKAANKIAGLLNWLAQVKKLIIENHFQFGKV